MEEKFVGLIETLDFLNWFSKSGREIEKDLFDFDFIQVDRNVMQREYTAIQWQTALNQASNRMRRTLDYDQRKAWNPATEYGLRYFDKTLSGLFLGFRENWNLNDAFVTWNRRCIAAFFTAEYFREYGFDTEFYDRCLKVSLKEYYPCGWQGGEWPDGKLLIY